MNGSVRSSAGLVWRHQRLVWWIFAVNLVLAWLSSLPTRATLSTLLDHSLESARLVAGFDLGAFVLLMEQPEVQIPALASAAAGAAVVFLVYLLFLDGGVFAVYLEDRKLNRAEFFESAGLYFWRMVRLALYSLVPFALLAAAHGGIHKWADKLSNDAVPDRLGFFVDLGAGIVILLLSLLVRLWFDLAQARVVRDNERKVFRTLLGSFRLAFSSGLYWKYVGIGLFGAIVFSAGVAIWIFLPHRAMAASFLVLELVTVVQIAVRLWMKAASSRWVGLNVAFFAAVPVSEAVMTPEPLEAPISERPAPGLGGTDAPGSLEPPMSE
jgi:hypothetical protein